MTNPDAGATDDASRRRRAPGKRVDNLPAGVDPVIYKLTWHPEFSREIERRAAALNLSVQNFVKRACLSVGEAPEDRATIANELFALHRLLANMALNHNQYTKVANATRQVDDELQAKYDANFALLHRLGHRFDAVLDAFDAS